MSTTAQSAKKWIEESSPTVAQIQEMIQKLESRVEGWEGDTNDIEGSIEAIDTLLAHLESIFQSEPPETQISAPPLDTSVLIPDSPPVELSEQIKQKTFAALKAQLDKRSE